MIRNIIFDWGGVIKHIDFALCVSNFSKLSGYTLEKIRTTFNNESLFKEFEKGLISEQDFIYRVKIMLGIEVLDIKIVDAWNSILRETPDYKLKALLELKKEYRLFLLSNTNSLHASLGECQLHLNSNMTMKDFFEKMFYSHTLKMAKPDYNIFLKVASLAQINPFETLFVDDSQANCKAALKCGFNVFNVIADTDWRTPLEKYIKTFF